MLEAARARIAGAYALRAYLLASLAARSFRNALRQLRGKAGSLPESRPSQAVGWQNRSGRAAVGRHTAYFHRCEC
jgi:hypothetical protein